MTRRPSTSWDPVGKWYQDIVGDQGHYYHQNVIIPGVLRLLNFADKKPASLLDLACGQGVLSRHLPAFVSYVGVDISPQLIQAAQQQRHQPTHQFMQGDITQKLVLKQAPFTHATLILALQNIEHPLAALQNASRCLSNGASFVIVLNHPCFRIPRQSSWKVDQEQKVQYRRIDRYMSDMKIPINMQPSQGQRSVQTWSFHHPLSAYSQWLNETGFSIDWIEEWCSPKESEGSHAKMENRSRQEIPLFMALLARKKTLGS